MITIGTVTWNNLEYLKAFIESTKVLKFKYRLYIYVNEGKDGTVEYLQNFTGEEDYPNLDLLTYKGTEENVGMAIGFNYILGEFIFNQDSSVVFICNDDIILHESINNMIPFMESDSKIGMCCPSILPKDTSPKNINIEANKHLLINKSKIEPSGLEGPLMAFKKETIEKIGFFDTELVNSFQDCDIYNRVLKGGYSAPVFYGSCIYHKGGVSTSRNPDCHNKKYYEIFQRKHGG